MGSYSPEERWALPTMVRKHQNEGCTAGTESSQKLHGGGGLERRKGSVPLEAHHTDAIPPRTANEALVNKRKGIAVDLFGRQLHHACSRFYYFQ